jgi:tRNA(Ser,Leu) C12 N-acetylase TAN1
MATDVCEVFLAINEGGDWVVGTDTESVSESLANEYGAEISRIVAIRVHLNRPTVVVADVEVPDDLTIVAAEPQKIERAAE